MALISTIIRVVDLSSKRLKGAVARLAATYYYYLVVMISRLSKNSQKKAQTHYLLQPAWQNSRYGQRKSKGARSIARCRCARCRGNLVGFIFTMTLQYWLLFNAAAAAIYSATFLSSGGRGSAGERVMSTTPSG
ncbi:MAG TPA: hypothetical protein VNI77_09720 [Nitrososphaera sp.]|nr:hypothetical protein [Nitrososphaera sp.]